MTTWTLSAALNRALFDALATDPRVVVFGEDVGVSGGVFRVTDGLQAEYGDRRVFDTPISEAGIVGAAVGLCFAGWRPVVELQFDAFSYPALEQIIDHVAKMRMRTRGRVDMPITIRIPAFGGIKGKEHHGESPETYYAHTAGLKVVVPSSAARWLHAASPRDRGPRPGDRARTQGQVLGEGGRRARRGRARDRRRPRRSGRRRRHAGGLRFDGGARPRGRRRAGRGRHRGAGRRPPIALTARRRFAPALHRGDGPDRRDPRGPSPRRHGRRDRRPRDGARLRLPRRPRPARDRLGHALPARLARGRLPARAWSGSRPPPERRWPTDDRARVRHAGPRRRPRGGHDRGMARRRGRHGGA